MCFKRGQSRKQRREEIRKRRRHLIQHVYNRRNDPRLARADICMQDLIQLLRTCRGNEVPAYSFIQVIDERIAEALHDDRLRHVPGALPDLEPFQPSTLIRQLKTAYPRLLLEDAAVHELTDPRDMREFAEQYAELLWRENATNLSIQRDPTGEVRRRMESAAGRVNRLHHRRWRDALRAIAA